MMKIYIGPASHLNVAHKWFAWHPVVAKEVTPMGHCYYWVWLRTVTRKAVSAAGTMQLVYELPAVTVNNEMR